MGDGSRRVEALHAQESAGADREAAVVTNALLDYYSQNRAASGGMRVVDDDEAPFVNAEADAALTRHSRRSWTSRRPRPWFRTRASRIWRGSAARRPPSPRPGAPQPLPSRRTGGARRARPRRAPGGSPPRPLAGKRRRADGGGGTAARDDERKRRDALAEARAWAAAKRQSDAAAAVARDAAAPPSARRRPPRRRRRRGRRAAGGAWCGARRR